MSKVSDSIDELRQFGQAILHCALRGNTLELQTGLDLCRLYILRTAEIFREVKRNPFRVLWRWDPYEDLRGAAQEFIDRWGEE